MRKHTSSTRFRIGDALVQPERLTISLDGEEQSIEPKIMEVLVVLAEAAQQNEVLSSEQLLIKVWRGTFYGDNPVHKAITSLRKVFGDDPKSPRYIETIRKRGYRLIAPVSYPDDYRRVSMIAEDWRGGSPYVGLNAYDAQHASVFFGRSRTTAELLAAMRRQIDQQRRLVLVVGASGCGKSSLLNAGAIPLLTQKGGFDGLHALSVARCDLAGTVGHDAIERICASLMQWTLGDRTVFPPQSTDWLIRDLRSNPKIVKTAIEQAFLSDHPRKLDDQPHAHLLLVIDHAETLVASQAADASDHAAMERILQYLCDTPRVCVILVVRGDFYLAFAEAFPALTERKSGDGHLDVLTPRTGEIAEIIRVPAARAGLSFQREPDTGAHLDDALRDAANAHPDALPLLQHTLQALYERRNERDELCFDAYRDMGGLEGALAHHAERVFDALPEHIRDSLNHVLSRIVVMQPENDSISGRRVPRAVLDGKAVALAEAFVDARLFVAEHNECGPQYRVTHEALLRQWPRARDWIHENRRILLARIRLQRAAARWVEEGKRDDHLLNAGAPLDEATSVRNYTPEPLSQDEHELVARSLKQQSRLKRIRQLAVALLSGMAVLSGTMAIVASSMRDSAEDMGRRSTALSTFIIDEFSERLDPTGNLALIESIGSRIMSDCARTSLRDATTDDLVNCSQASRKLGDVMLERGFDTTSRIRLMQSRWLSDLARQQEPDSARSLFEKGRSAAWNGRIQHALGSHVLALIDWRNHAVITDRLRQARPLDAGYLMESSYAANNLGLVYRDIGLDEMAQQQFQTSVSMKEAAIRSSAENREWRFESIVSASFLARMEESRGQLDQAALRYEGLIEALRDVLRKDPSAREWERQLTSLLQFDAALSLNRGDIGRARLSIDDAISRLERMTRSEPTNMAWRRFLAQAYLVAGEIERCDGNEGTANDRFQLALSTANHPMLSTAASRRIKAMASLRISLTRSSDSIQTAVDALQDLVDDNRRDPYAWLALTEGLVLLAERDHRRKDFTAATSSAREAIGLLSTPPSGFDKDPVILAIESRARAISGNTEEPLIHGELLKRIGFRHPDYSAMQARRVPR
ncbi:MAG TPA: winged helix-turn-helix domain-containing protein [Xanthomonadaceae bacterium]